MIIRLQQQVNEMYGRGIEGKVMTGKFDVLGGGGGEGNGPFTHHKSHTDWAGIESGPPQ